jgi:hypothetical protein
MLTQFFLLSGQFFFLGCFWIVYCTPVVLTLSSLPQFYIDGFEMTVFPQLCFLPKFMDWFENSILYLGSPDNLYDLQNIYSKVG